MISPMIHQRTRLSAAMEDYLKAIFHLDERGSQVTTAGLATTLGVAAPSVTNMVKRLDEIGLVLHSPYHGIELSTAGRAVAVEIVRHHRLIELYLAEFLDVPWDLVHDEAERLEHVISEDLETRMAEKLGQPGFDPHGDPIPTQEGTIPESPLECLWETELGERVVIARVSDRDPGLLSYLGELGLIPGAVVEVVGTSAYGGTQDIRVGDVEHVIGAELSKSIRIRPVTEGVAG
jgi:DtxR family Mn-dependent transcriptional regulator